MFDTKIKWIWLSSSWDELRQRMLGKEVLPIGLNQMALLLVHHNNEFYLVKNRCPHQGIRLDKAQCQDGYIVCPWHHYGFDLKTGRGAGLHLENFPLEERADGIYAGFEYFSWF